MNPPQQKFTIKLPKYVFDNASDQEIVDFNAAKGAAQHQMLKTLKAKYAKYNTAANANTQPAANPNAGQPANPQPVGNSNSQPVSNSNPNSQPVSTPNQRSNVTFANPKSSRDEEKEKMKDMIICLAEQASDYKQKFEDSEKEKAALKQENEALKQPKQSVVPTWYDVHMKNFHTVVMHILVHEAIIIFAFCAIFTIYLSYVIKSFNTDMIEYIVSKPTISDKSIETLRNLITLIITGCFAIPLFRTNMYDLTVSDKFSKWLSAIGKTRMYLQNLLTIIGTIYIIVQIILCLGLI